MPLDYQSLRTELQQDPTGLGYGTYLAVGNYAMPAVLLNTPSASLAVRVRLLPLARLAMWAAGNAVRGKIETAAANVNSPVRAVVLALRDLFTGLAGPPFDLDDPANQSMMDTLVTAGVLVDGTGASLKANLLAQGNRSPASRAEVLWGADTVIRREDVEFVWTGMGR